MNNDTGGAVAAHNLLLKRDPSSTEHLVYKYRMASILASPQAARKKRFIKLELGSVEASLPAGANPFQYSKTAGGTAQHNSEPDRGKRTLLKELATEDGEIKGQEDLAHYVCSFYTHLYTSEANAPDTSEVREACRASTPIRVSNETNMELIKELTLKEVQDAISAMPKGKAPGCDGILTESF
ncbi:unnamed protein product [Sphagnum jensenii]|uniref:Uncharacterized protein n=1 Tax=Sphagnum jensenii TaxID=128206 RepID=A0ABP0WZR5_9BRYO